MKLFLYSETIRRDTYSQLSCFSYSMNPCASQKTVIKSKRKVSSFSIYPRARLKVFSSSYESTPSAKTFSRCLTGLPTGLARHTLVLVYWNFFFTQLLPFERKWVGSYRKCAWVTSPFLRLLHRRMTILRMEMFKLSSSHVLGLSKIRMLTKKIDRRWPAEDEAIYHGREPSCCQSRCLVDDTAGSAGSSFFLLVSLLDLRPSIINIRLSLCLRHETSWIFPALYSIIICALDAIIQTHLQMESFSIASTRAPHKVAHFMFFTELPTCTILLTFSTHLHLERRRRRRVKNNWNFHKSCWRSRELRDA